MPTKLLATWRIAFRGDGGAWEICPNDGTGAAPAVWAFPYREEDRGQEPPPEVRAVYEWVNGLDNSVRADPNQLSGPDVVEIISGTLDDGFNQPCRFGNLVEGHAVYCHNERWIYAPRKCRRTWHSGGELRDEDCLGYLPNPRKTPT